MCVCIVLGDGEGLFYGAQSGVCECECGGWWVVVGDDHSSMAVWGGVQHRVGRQGSNGCGCVVGGAAHVSRSLCLHTNATACAHGFVGKPACKQREGGMLQS